MLHTGEVDYKQVVDASSSSDDEDPNHQKALRLGAEISQDSVEQAAVLLINAQACRKPLVAERMDKTSRTIYRWIHAKYWRSMFGFLSILFMIMGLAPWQHLEVLEWFLLIFFAADLVLAARVLEPSQNQYIPTFLRDFSLGTADGYMHVRVALLLLQVIDLLMFHIHGTVRISVWTRPLVLTLRMSKLRGALLGVFNAGLKIFWVMLLIFVDLLFFSFAGFILFSDLPNNTFFVTWPQSLYTMLLVLTAPGTVLDAMNSVFHATDPAAPSVRVTFFVLFVLVTTMLLQKMVLATAYRSYKDYQRSQFMDNLKRRKVSLLQAFELMAGPSPQAPAGPNQPNSTVQGGGAAGLTINAEERIVKRPSWRRLFLALDENNTRDVADSLFALVDADHSGSVDEQEFLKLCGVGLTAMATVDMADLNNREEGWFGQLRAWLRDALDYEVTIPRGNGKTWRLCPIDTLVDLLVLASVAQLYYSVTSVGAAHVFWRSIGVALLALFGIDVLIRVTAYGWHEYISDAEHVLDVLCCVVGASYFIVDGLFFSGHASQGSDEFYRLALVLRTLRAGRFLWLSRTLNNLLFSLLRLTDALLRLFFVMFVPLYIGASIAMPLYQDQLVSSNPLLYNQTTGLIVPAAAKWEVYSNFLNFSGGGTTLLTLWEIITVSNWPIVMTAVVTATGQPWNEVFFLTFRMLMTMIFVPVLTGFVIEAFVSNFNALAIKHRLESEQRKKAEAQGIVSIITS